MAQGHLPNNTRITALKMPLVDADRGIAVSIRLLHPSRVSRNEMIVRNTATSKMIDFMCMLLRYGVSFVVAGATSSGKTTLLNAILSSIPDDKRIFTIESGARELSLVRRDENGHVINNVVHTLSRPAENESNEVSQEDLVVASLRFNPDVVVVGEMRDVEAYSAVEAAVTGHTVVSTIHAYAADSAHMRLALLCQKRFSIDFNLSLTQAAQAFPVVVYAHKLEDNSRKVMDISECLVDQQGNREYRTLFRYAITKNELVDGKFKIEGHFEQANIMSDNLKSKLVHFGVPQELLQQFLGTPSAEYERRG
jgi:pilus assembly protein CpaF